MNRIRSSCLKATTRQFATTRSSARPAAPKKMDGVGEDPRPPWVYVGTRLISMAVVPALGIYSVFLYDFGEQEHVFQPIRRWAKSQIHGFLVLSPAEQQLLKQRPTTFGPSEADINQLDPKG